MGDLRFDRAAWPDPEGMMRDFLKAGIRTVLINEPYIRPGTRWLRELARLGFLAKDAGGRPALFEGPWRVPQYLFDFTHPGARRWWWEKLRPLFDSGVAGWWCDLGEPQDHPAGLDHHAGPAEQVRNGFTYEWNRAIYEGQRAVSNLRVYQLSRSGCAGLQKFGAGVWTHDVAGNFKRLAWHFHVGQNVGLSGIPYWGLDVGGFEKHGSLNPEWYVRSFQFAAFCPNFRGHADHEPREPWAFGDEAERICREFAELRMRLIPYVVSLSWDAHERGLPYLRPVFLELPDDPAAWEMPDQFMFGPSLLVAPVAEGRNARRAVRLPAGRWWDFWTGRPTDGPAALDVVVPLDRVPIYVRDGSILPLVAPMRHAFEKIWDPVTLRVYGEGSFTLIEEDGLTYDYERGIVTRTEIVSRRRAGKVEVEISDPRGPYPVPANRRWIVERFEGR
jgi:alpha-glucosidase